MKINRQVVYLVSSIILILLALASAFLGGWIPAQYTYGFIGLTFLFCALSQWELYRDNGKRSHQISSIIWLALALLNLFIFLRDIGLFA